MSKDPPEPIEDLLRRFDELRHYQPPAMKISAAESRARAEARWTYPFVWRWWWLVSRIKRMMRLH